MIQPAQQPESVMTPTLATLAEIYAQALLDQAPDEDGAQALGEELAALADVLQTQLGARELFATALLSVTQRREMIERIFQDRVSEPMAAFLGVLARRDRLPLLEPIARMFPRLLARRRGMVEVTVTAARELGDDQQRMLMDELRSIFRAEPILTTHVDPAVLGGLIVQAGDRVFDASVAGQVRRFRKHLKERIEAQRPGRAQGT